MITLFGYFLTAVLAIAGLPYVFGGLAILWLIICLARKSRYNEALKMTATQHICPSCNSTNIKIQPLMTGAITTSVGYGSLGIAKSNMQNVKIAICQDCGTDFYYYTEQDIKQIQRAAYKSYDNAQLVTAVFIVLTVLTVIVLREFWPA